MTVLVRALGISHRFLVLCAAAMAAGASINLFIGGN
jgi:hypothetical protein